MNISPTRKHRKVYGNKSSLKKLFLRSLRMENLERRELMAADIDAYTPFHNGLIPQDVDGDFHVSPLDALMVINSLNTAGAGGLLGRTPPNARTGMVDTDGDNLLSPLDVLNVINTLNRPEGELDPTDEVAVSYEFYRVKPDGTAGDQIEDITDNGRDDVSINAGELFIIRTLMQDLRNANAGVFSAYHDLTFRNLDNATTEKLQLQWSDYNLLQIKMADLFPNDPNRNEIAVLTGNFKLQVGNQTTDPIEIVLERDGRDQLVKSTGVPTGGTYTLTVNDGTTSQTTAPINFSDSASTVRTRLAALSNVGSTNNVNVTGSLSAGFRITFVGALQTKAFRPITVAENQFAGGPITVSLLGPADKNRTAANIDAALEKLLGAGNVLVSANNAGSTDLGYKWDITYRETLARQNRPALSVVGEENLKVSEGPAPVVSITDLPSPSESNSDALRGAMFRNFATTTGNLYVNGIGGVLAPVSNTPSARRLKAFGGFSVLTSSTLPNDVPQKIVDTVFRATTPGDIEVKASLSELPTDGNVDPGQVKNLGIAFAGGQSYVTNPQLVTLPTWIVQVVDKLSATDNSFTQKEDATATYAVAADDSAQNNLPFGIVSVTQPSNNAGSVQIVAGANSKSVTFIPTQDYVGQTSFTYTIRATEGSQVYERTATVSLTITPVNDAPRANQSLSFTVSEGSAATVSVTDIFSQSPANEFADPQNQTISLALVNPLPNANQLVPTINNNGQLVLTAQGDFFTAPGQTIPVVVTGTDNGPLLTDPQSPLRDSDRRSTTVTLAVSVTPVNDAPQVVGTTFTVSEDPVSPLTITPAQLFTPGPNEASTQTVTISIVTAPSASQGTASIVNGSLQFSPIKDFFGEVLMTVRGTDSVTPNPLSTESTITITVNNVNDAPIANPDSGSDFSAIALAGAKQLLVLANDSAGPGGESEPIEVDSVSAVSPSNFGTVTIAQDRKSILFTPTVSVDGTFPKTATFTYIIKDVPAAGSGQALTSQPATVTVTILPPASPYALDDQETINEDAGEVFFDVLENDIVKQGVTPAATKFFTNNQPNVLEATPDLVKSIIVDATANKIKFEANPNRSGTVKFTYEMDSSVQEGTNQRKTATATIIVNAVNDAPVAVDKTLEMDEDGAPFTVNVGALNLSSGAFENDSLVFVSPTLTDPSVGTLRFTAGSNSFVYEPAKDFFGDALVKYKVRDNGTPPAESNEATITIKVKPVNDPPIATSDPRADWNPATNPDNRFTTPENNPLTISSSVLLANDKPGPANEADQTVSFVSLAGTPGPTSGTFLTAKGGTVRVSSDNNINNNNHSQLVTYTPKQSYNNTEGLDTFTYVIRDSLGAEATGTVTINVTEVNDPPVNKSNPATPVKVEKLFPGENEAISLSVELNKDNWPRGPVNESSQDLTLYSFSPTSRVTTADLLDEQSGLKIGTISIAPDGKNFTYTIPFDPNVQVIRMASVKFYIRDDGKTGAVTAPEQAEGIIKLEIEPSKPSSISGTLFLDADDDGVQDHVGNLPSEAPIGGVEVTLSVQDSRDPSKMNHVRTEMTAADGSYDFYKLRPGTYTVSYSTPQQMISGPSTARTRTITIGNRGGVDAVFNFAVRGINPELVTYLEYLASSSNPNNPSGRQGMHAVVNKDGVTEWVSYYGRPTGASFYEVVVSNDGTTAYLTEVSANGDMVKTATLGRRDFFRMATSDGGQMVRVLKDPSSITNWTNLDPSFVASTAAKAKGYLSMVDNFFEQDEWDEDAI